MEAKAIAKMQRISPIKARLVIDTIRGKKVSDALAILENTNKKAAILTKKVLKSAVEYYSIHVAASDIKIKEQVTS